MFVSGAKPITFIGDSHTLAYADLVFRDTADALFVTRSNYCRGITASAFVDAGGSLNADVLQVMLAAGFVERLPSGLVARHRASDLHSAQVGIAMQRPREAPVLVFSIGDLDLKLGFIQEFAAADFELPPGYGFDPAPFPAEAARERVPFALAASFVRRLLAPYFRGLGLLARLGFEHLYVHALPPQTLDDDAFERINGFRAPARLRYKATRLFNAIMRDFVRDYPEFGIVDTWDRVTTDGIVAAAFHLDDSHLNRRGALLAVEDVIGDLARRTGRRIVSPVAASVPLASTMRGTRFAQDGIFAIDLGSDAAAAMRANLTFAPDPDGATVRSDWMGEPLGGSRFVVAARPDTAFIERFAQLLFFAGEPGAAIADCVGAAFTVASLRVLKTLAPEDKELGLPPLFARSEPPPGAVRGIFYLTGVKGTDESRVFTARRGATVRLQPSAGTLVLYDPRRFNHRESPGGHETVDLLFTPAGGAPARIVSAGSNHYWPLDPAAFDRAGLTVYEVAFS